MGVARDDLNELIDFALEGPVRDPVSIHLAESELRALSDESQGVRGVLLVQVLLVLKTDIGWCAVDHHGGLAQRLVVLVGRLDADLSKSPPCRAVADEIRAPLDQMDDLGTIRQ
jgi:hypothetical protein